MKHITYIPKGQHGEMSKVREEQAELEDAHFQKYPAFVVVEAADLINATLRFVWKHYRVPGILVIALYFIRIPYKALRGKK